MSTESEPYLPSYDTYLLCDYLQSIKRKAKKVLEIGTGSGIISRLLSQKGSCVVGTDVNIRALRECVQISKERGCGIVDYLRCDGAQPFRRSFFDLIVFNPPYLPSGDIKDRSVDGGYGGIEVMKKWLSQCDYVLAETSRIIFVISDLADINGLRSYGRKIGLGLRIVRSKELFFEKLYIIVARRLS